MSGRTTGIGGRAGKETGIGIGTGGGAIGAGNGETMRAVRAVVVRARSERTMRRERRGVADATVHAVQ